MNAQHRRFDDGKGGESVWQEIVAINVTLDNLTKSIEESKVETREYRKALCAKLDKINERIDLLPYHHIENELITLKHSTSQFNAKTDKEFDRVDRRINVCNGTLVAIFLAVLTAFLRLKSF